ncbi:hypothetical protein [Dietzia sp. PP-33]|uniref:hypothetical protein n=1 Tax=Dietzia sp. PP-33 TaxID=2957500 RepID=UPI0029B5B54D|nr:hypothetical protein [Dietzia sp. PP-33]MDX2358878.1 hypothetical protein [Dietzia sp. PP-33]
MSARRHALRAVVAAVLAVVLWWLSRDFVAVRPPEVDPPVEGMILRIHTEPWLLMAAALAAGLAMVSATLAVLGRRPRPRH